MRAGPDADAPLTSLPAPVDPQSHVVQELSHLFPALWRGLMRATPESEQMPVLESQVSILRTLEAAGPMPPTKLASALYLARSTISNLIRDLVSDGLLERRISEIDGRSAVLTVTAHGRRVLETFRVGRAEVLSNALHDLDADDLEKVTAALPAFGRLLDTLDRVADGVESAALERATRHKN